MKAVVYNGLRLAGQIGAIAIDDSKEQVVRENGWTKVVLLPA